MSKPIYATIMFAYHSATIQKDIFLLVAQSQILRLLNTKGTFLPDLLSAVSCFDGFDSLQSPLAHWAVLPLINGPLIIKHYCWTSANAVKP